MRSIGAPPKEIKEPNTPPEELTNLNMPRIGAAWHRNTSRMVMSVAAAAAPGRVVHGMHGDASDVCRARRTCSRMHCRTIGQARKHTIMRKCCQWRVCRAAPQLVARHRGRQPKLRPRTVTARTVCCRNDLLRAARVSSNTRTAM